MPVKATAPTITVSFDNTTFTITASSTDADINASTWQHFITDTIGTIDCADSNNASKYTSGQAITLSTEQRKRRQTVCFKVDDNDDNTGYKQYDFRDTVRDTTPPTITTSLSGNTVSASSPDADIDLASWSYLVTTTNPGSSCSNNVYDYSLFPANATIEVTLTTEQRRTTQYVCFSVGDYHQNAGFSAPHVVSPPDTTPPTITTSISGNTVTASSTASDLSASTWQHHVQSGGSAPTCDSGLSYSDSGSTYTRTGKGLEHVCFTVSDTSGNAGYSSVVTLAAVTTPNPGPNPNPNTPQNPSTNPDSTPNTNPDSNTNNSNQPTTPSTTTNPAPGSNTRDRNPAPNTSPDANNQTPRETSTPGSNTTSEVSQGDGSNNATNPATTPTTPETNQEDGSITTQNVDTAQTSDITPDQDDSKKTSSKKRGLSSLDYLGLGVIAAITTAIIIIFVKKQRSTTEAADDE